jgi:leucyl aminopeptidase (aminopeptidase T)
MSYAKGYIGWAMSGAVVALATTIVGCAPGSGAAGGNAGGASSTATGAGSSMRAAAAPVNLDSLAMRIVTQSAGIGEGDIAVISGSTRDMEFLEDLAVQSQKLGAYAMITVGSDRLARRSYDDVPAKYDGQPPKLGLKLGAMADVYINVETGESDKVLDGVPAQRIAARTAADAPVNELVMSRGVRSVNVGNELYPTQERAMRYGMSMDSLSRLFWNGINVDYSQLQMTAERVRAALAAGQQVHLTNPNGTDLTLGIAKRPVFVSDGVISADDRKRGGAATAVWLPAGEAFLAPVRGTAEGKIVATQLFFEGNEIRNLTLTISKGKVTNMTAQSGLEPLKARYDAAGAGKDQFGVIDFGLNSSITVGSGSKLLTWVPAGMVSVVIGTNTWAGGDNRSNFGLSAFLPGSTVTIDGKPLVKDGQLQMPAGGS